MLVGIRTALKRGDSISIPSMPRAHEAPAGSTRAWLVDLDGTLYRASWVKLAMTLELCAREPSALSLIRRFRHAHEQLRGAAPGEPFRLQIERTALATGIPPARIEACVRQWMLDRPGRWIRLARNRALIEEIRVFRRSGGRTAIVSDYPAAQKLAALGVADLFDVVVAVGEEGGPPRLKPAPDGYLLAAQRLDVAPAECLVIGDQDHADGAAARAAAIPFRRVR